MLYFHWLLTPPLLLARTHNNGRGWFLCQIIVVVRNISNLYASALAPAPLRKYVDVFPFPAHFALLRKDLPDFSAAAKVDYKKEIKQRKFSLHPVTRKRFGCYAIGAKTKWEGQAEEACAYADGVFDGSGDGFQYGSFVFDPLYDEDEYMSAIVSVWKIRGDSLDFYTILDKCFISEGWNTNLQIDSVTSISTKQKRIYGRISWEGEKRQRIVRPWSAMWILPDKLDVR